MEGFGGMEVEGRSSSGGKGGGELAADESTFTHAGDDDATGTGEDAVKGALEIGGHGSSDAVSKAAQSFSFDANDVFTCGHMSEGVELQ